MNKLFITRLFLFCLCGPVIGPWALCENNAQEFTNQRAHYIAYEDEPYNKITLIHVTVLLLVKLH